MYKLAILGESDSVLAFKAVGFDSFHIHPEDARRVLMEKYHSGKYAVIFISENIALGLEELLIDLEKEAFPAVSILPLGRKGKNVGMERLRVTSIKATGTDIVSKLR